MRSEAMLENHRVRESNGREAAERTPHFAISESRCFVGRVAALAGDSDKAGWTGGSPCSGQLSRVYGFNDVDGTRPVCWRYVVEVVENRGATPGDAG